MSQRYKNWNWSLPDCRTWDTVKIAVLMDIRDELQQLNQLLGCDNFIRIPAVLRQIRTNTSKPKRRKTVKK